MILKGEHKTRQEAEATLKQFQKGEVKGTYRIVPNECGEKEAFPFLIQMKDNNEWLCLHD